MGQRPRDQSSRLLLGQDPEAGGVGGGKIPGLDVDLLTDVMIGDPIHVEVERVTDGVVLEIPELQSADTWGGFTQAAYGNSTGKGLV